MSLSSLQLLSTDLYRIMSRAASMRSFFQYSIDRVLFSCIKNQDMPGTSGLRELNLRDGLSVLYRRNRGDIWSIREVLLEECYRLPLEQKIDVFVDLGANIGLTTLWVGKRYSPEISIAVEPNEANFDIAKRNFERNEMNVSLLKAAVGASDGEASFREHSESNMGRLDEEGDSRVTVLSMNSVLSEIPENRAIDLLKVDIEGGEEELFSGDLSWLSRVQTIIAEFHPHLVDCQSIADRIVENGFRHIKAGEVFPSQMECFVRG